MAHPVQPAADHAADVDDDAVRLVEDKHTPLPPLEVWRIDSHVHYSTWQQDAGDLVIEGYSACINSDPMTSRPGSTEHQAIGRSLMAAWEKHVHGSRQGEGGG